jgi:hypothetical protein
MPAFAIFIGHLPFPFAVLLHYLTLIGMVSFQRAAERYTMKTGGHLQAWICILSKKINRGSVNLGDTPPSPPSPPPPPSPRDSWQYKLYLLVILTP